VAAGRDGADPREVARALLLIEVGVALLGLSRVPKRVLIVLGFEVGDGDVGRWTMDLRNAYWDLVEEETTN